MLIKCKTGDPMKRKILIFAVLFVFGFFSGKTLAGPDGVKFENDSPVVGWIVDFGADHLTIFSPFHPFVVTFEEIANIASYELPLMAAVVGRKAVGIRTAVVHLPSGEKERRIMRMRFLSKLE